MITLVVSNVLEQKKERGKMIMHEKAYIIVVKDTKNIESKVIFQ